MKSQESTHEDCSLLEQLETRLGAYNVPLETVRNWTSDRIVATHREVTEIEREFSLIVRNNPDRFAGKRFDRLHRLVRACESYLRNEKNRVQKQKAKE